MERAKNTIGNYVYQFGNLMLPLLIMSLLSHLMSPKEFGYFAIAQVLIAYANVITDYGSQVSVVKEGMTINVELKYRNSVFFTTVIATKLLLFVASSLILLPFLFLYLPERNSISIVIVIALIGASNISWFFMISEEMLAFGIINIISRAMSMCLIFIYGNRVSLDQALMVVLFGGLLLNVGSYIHLLIYKRRYISIILHSSILSAVIDRLRSDWPIFKTIAYGSLLSNSGSIILASYADPRTVGGYNMIEKIARGSTFGIAPLLQARIKSSAIHFSSIGDLSFNKIAKFSAWPLMISLFISLFLCILHFSGVLRKIFPENIAEFSDNLLVFAIWIPLAVLNNILGIQILNNIGEGKYYSKKFLIATAVSVILFFVMPRFFIHFGTSIAILSGEILLFSMLLKRVLFFVTSRGEVK